MTKACNYRWSTPKGGENVSAQTLIKSKDISNVFVLRAAMLSANCANGTNIGAVDRIF